MMREYFEKMMREIESGVEYPDGAIKACREYVFGDSKDEYILSDTLWDKEIHDFIDTLRKAGVETFVIISASTNLMENIHGFVNEGCKIAGTCVVKAKNEWSRDKLGLRFEL